MTAKSSEEKERFMSLIKRIPGLSKDKDDLVVLSINSKNIITVDIKQYG